ncbi:MAG: ABC transporter permease [Andreesenia angusta]|nr:ABC transporter permease [Andreesenia angusta]
MRNPINKRLKRELFDNIGRYIAIFIVILVTIVGISSFFIVQKNIKETYDLSMKNGKVEDGQIKFSEKLTKKQMQELEKEDIRIYENHYIEYDLKKNKKIRVFKNRKNINLPELFEGRLAKNDDEIALERLFAKYNSYDIGDSIKIGKENYKIVGIMAVPDYPAILKSGDGILLDNSNYGIGLLSDGGFNKLDKNKVNYQYSYRLNKRDLNIKEQTDKFIELNKIMKKNNLLPIDGKISPANKNITFIIDDMDTDIPTMYGLLFIMMIIMAFLFTVIIKSTIEDEAPMIGTLLSMGYKRKELIFHYMIIPISITLFASVIGNIISYSFFKEIYKEIYYKSFSLFPYKVSLNFRAFFMTTIIPIIMILIINISSLSIKLKSSPLRFLRRDLRIIKMKNAIKLPNISFIRRFRLRIFLENKANYLVILLGLFFANSLLVFGLGIGPIFDTYVQNIESEVLDNYEYILKAPIPIDGGEKLTVSNMESVRKVFGKSVDIQVKGFDKENLYFKDYKIKENSNDAYLSTGIMKKFKLKKDDEFILYDKFLDKKIKLRIKGRIDDTGSLLIYMDKKKLNDFLEEDKNYFNSYISDKKLDINEEYIMSVIKKEDMKDIGEQLTELIKDMIPIIVVISIVIYIVIIYVLTKMIIDRSERSISYLQIFGYRRKEINKIFINVSTISIFLFFIILIPLENLVLKKFFELVMLQFNGYAEPKISKCIYIERLVLGMAIYYIVRIFNIRMIKNSDMTKALKDVQG